MTQITMTPDILECEVKWSLGSITKNKARGGDGIPAELFQIFFFFSFIFISWRLITLQYCSGFCHTWT